MFSILFVLMASNTVAAECVDQAGKDIYMEPEIYTALIENAQSCSSAVQLAQSCAYGSSQDSSTAGAAYDVCYKEFVGLQPQAQSMETLNKMEVMCEEKYGNLDGTMYISANAFCRLSALQWILGIAYPN